MRRSLPALLVVAVLGSTVAWQWSQPAWLFGKAWLARGLIERAWQLGMQQGTGINRPWPRADTWPVLSLAFPGRGKQFRVLAGSTGNVLAFGPGLLPESARPGFGPVFIAGHRDTHFAFLEGVKPGDVIEVTSLQGDTRRYAVRFTSVLDTAEHQLEVSPDQNVLVLITCYPFHALHAGGSLRFLVWAEPVGSHVRVAGVPSTDVSSRQ